MRKNPTTGGLTLDRSHKVVRAVTAKQQAKAGELKTGSTTTRRVYSAQVKVVDPEGREILSLTKLAFEDDLNGRGLATLDMREVLELLVEAAGEWSA